MHRSAQRRMPRTTPCSGGVPGGHARPGGSRGGSGTRGADPVLSERELAAAIGSAAYGPDGEKIGTVEHFFTDDRTGAATWVAVSTGLFGTRHSVVPAADATFADGSVRLPVTKEAVRTAPSVSDQHLDPDAEALLRQHYGLDSGTGTTAPAVPAGDDTTTRDLSRAPRPRPPTTP